MVTTVNTLATCDLPLDPTGYNISGTSPEQFWNVAEVEIGNGATPVVSPPAPTPTAPIPTAPIPTAPTPTVPAPTVPAPTAPSGSGSCCPATGYALKASGDCTKFYSCNNGLIVGTQSCSAGLLFDENLQVCNWANQVTCNSSCARRALRGS